MRYENRVIRNILMFLTMPIAMFVLDLSGRPRGEWNTWLVSGENSAQRQYRDSVTMMFCIWVGIFITGVFCVVVHVMLLNQASAIRYFVDIAMCLLLITWLILLSPKIMLSYETWNWVKAFKFLTKMHKSGYSKKNELKNIVLEHLVIELGVAKESGLMVEFNHLENVFRCLDLWKGKRGEIVDKLNGTHIQASDSENDCLTESAT